MVSEVITPGLCLKNMMNNNKIIITGGNGFLGSHIVKLFSDNSVGVSCLVREESKLDNIKGFEVDFKRGDVRDKQSLVDAFKDHDFVIHNAAYAKDWGDYDTFYQTNVEGTLNVLNACFENGIKDVIMTSTNSVYGEESTSEIKKEGSPFKSHYPYFLDNVFPSKMNYYRDTKRIACEKALDLAERNGLNLTILEPVWIYGENGADTIFIEYLKSIQEGIPVSPGTIKNKFHVIYAVDVAQAYYLAFKRRLQGIHRIILGNHEREYMDKILSLFCEYAEVRKPFLLPKWSVYPLGFVLELIYTIFHIKKPPLLTRARINTFYDNIEYSTNYAEEILGFRAQYTLQEGIKNTVQWYKG